MASSDAWLRELMEPPDLRPGQANDADEIVPGDASDGFESMPCRYAPRYVGYKRRVRIDALSLISYSILLDPTRSYSILLDPTRSYSILLDPTRSYPIVLDPTLSYSIVLYPTRPLSSLRCPTPSCHQGSF